MLRYPKTVNKICLKKKIKIKSNLKNKENR